MEPKLVIAKNLSDFLADFQLNQNTQLDSLNFQSTPMEAIFHKFPSVLLFCRTPIFKGNVLYALFVDSPDVQVEENIQKLVHIAVPKNESIDGLSRMFSIFKEFNPDWPYVKTVLVDPLFTGTDALADAFPSAEIVLSVFHICKYFQQKIYRMSLETKVEEWLLGILKDTVCSATKRNLRNMYDMLNKVLSPELFTPLNCHWLLNDKIWGMHNWRGVSESNHYFQSLEILTHDLSRIFTTAVSFESSIIAFAKYIQECKSSDVVSSLDLSTEQEYRLACGGADQSIQEASNVIDSCPSSRVNVWDAVEHTVVQGMVKEDDEVRRSLQRLCTVPAAVLCLQELATALASVRLVGDSENKVHVQIVEDGNVVSKNGPLLCTCHFSKSFELPCRHALAALKESKEALQREMVFEKWQKKESGNSDRSEIEGDMVELLQSSWSASQDRVFTVKFLTDELMRLLAECGTDEFENKYNTLRELADSWIGPYEQVKL